MSVKYKPTIGIEIHCQLATKSKMFCSCVNDSNQSSPNKTICPICLGLPGTLPTINKAAIELAIKLGLGLNGTIAKQTKFDRKNYFYPDLPKGYQITQYDQPIIGEGSVTIEVDGEEKIIGIDRAHLEEDAAKLIHPPGASYSLVDYNRAGTPLVEIVSRPDMSSPAEAKAYLQKIYAIATRLGITSGNMQQGNFKFDLNVSVSADDKLGAKVELKNLNSFRFAFKALEHEIDRQTKLIEKGEQITQETRGYNEIRGETFSQRSKEQAHDYRYFPEPDLPPFEPAVVIGQSIKQLQDEVDNVLAEVVHSNDEAVLKIVSHNNTEEVTALVKNYLANSSLVAKKLAEISDNSRDDNSLDITATNLASLATAQLNGKLSSTQAKKLVHEMISDKDETDLFKGNQLISDYASLESIVREIIDANPRAVADYRAGRENALRFLVGQVMKQSKGTADPSKVIIVMRELIT